MINPAGKDIIVHCAAPPFKPRQQAGPSVWKQFELNRPTGFLLHHDCTRSDLPAADNVADLHLYQVAPPQFAVDRQVEQRPISQAAALIEVKSDLPYLLRFQRALRADGPSGIPDWALCRGGFGLRHLHDHSPMARVAVRRTLWRLMSRNASRHLPTRMRRSPPPLRWQFLTTAAIAIPSICPGSSALNLDRLRYCRTIPKQSLFICCSRVSRWHSR